MKKYLIILLVLAFTVSMMFMGIGCKEEAAEEEVAEEAVEEEVAEEAVEEEVAEEAAKMELVYDPSIPVNDGKEITLHMWQHTNVWEAFFNKWFAEYMEIHPNVTLVFDLFAGQGSPEFYAKLTTAANAGEGPDMYFAHNEYARVYESIAAPYTEDTIPAELIVENFTYAAESISPDGNMYVFALDMMTDTIFYNKKIWREAGLTESDIPKTWDKLMEIAKKLTKYDDQGNVVQAGYNATSSQDTVWACLMVQQGKFLMYNVDEGVFEFNSNSPESIKAAQFVKDIYYKHKVDNGDFPPVWEVFGSGKAAIGQNWGWVQGFFNANYPELEWGSFILPTLDGEIPPAYCNRNASLIWAISNKVPEENQAVAFDFLKFILSNDDAMVEYSIADGAAPNKLSLRTDPRLHEMQLVQMEQAKRAVYRGPLPDSYYAANSPPLFEMVADEAITPEEAMEKAQRQLESDFPEGIPGIIEHTYQYADEFH